MGEKQMSELVITPKFHVGQTVLPEYLSDITGMTIERVEVVSVVCYIIDGVSWSEDELRAESLKETETRLRSNLETNAKIEEAKSELEHSTEQSSTPLDEVLEQYGVTRKELECEHTDFFGNPYTARLYRHKYCPDCGINLGELCNHAIALAFNGDNDYPFAYCPFCGDKL
jgi:hypothetical protein